MVCLFCFFGGGLFSSDLTDPQIQKVGCYFALVFVSKEIIRLNVANRFADETYPCTKEWISGVTGFGLLRFA